MPRGIKSPYANVPMSILPKSWHLNYMRNHWDPSFRKPHPVSLQSHALSSCMMGVLFCFAFAFSDLNRCIILSLEFYTYFLSVTSFVCCWVVKGDRRVIGDWKSCIRSSEWELSESACLATWFSVHWSPKILGDYFVIQPHFNGPILILFYCYHISYILAYTKSTFLLSSYPPLVNDGEDVGPRIVPDPVTGLIDVKKNPSQVPAPGKPTVEQNSKLSSMIP